MVLPQLSITDIVDSPRETVPPLRNGWGIGLGKVGVGEGEGGELGTGDSMQNLKSFK